MEKDIEKKEERKEKSKNKKDIKLNNNMLLGCVLLVVFLGIILFVISSRKPNITVSVQSSLEKLVDRADLETANLNYNFVAKKCNDNKECDLNSNNIDDFDMVVSCKSIITVGLDFDKVKVVDDKANKVVKISIPEPSIKEINPGSVKFLNGDELEAEALVDARKLCEDTAKEKSSKDEKFMQAAKDQAIVVIKSFYEKWIKAINDSYSVEIN